MVATIAAGTTAAYYLQQSEYYLAESEPTGRWVVFDESFGAVTEADVTRELFERLHAGLDPAGLPLGDRNRDDRCTGYDVTFSAPKSVSVVWAISDIETRTAIEAAQARAVTAALTLLNDEAAWARRGEAGASLERVRLVAATFQHGEARPAEHVDGSLWADPQLHTHSVILNLARREDGTVGALDGRALFRNKMVAGAVYHAQFAAELNQLGFELEVTGKNGLFEIAGIDEATRRHFSARREAIEEAIGAHGLTTDAAPQLAAAITAASRNVKVLSDQDRHTRWCAELASLGHEPGNFVESLRQHAMSPQQTPAAELAKRLAAIPQQLTATESVFERRHLIAAVASVCVGTGFGAERVPAEVARLSESGAIVTLGQDALGHELYSTPEMIRLEAELGEISARSAHRRGFVISSTLANSVCDQSGLSAEQNAAVRSAAAPKSLAIIEGAAGSGKTTTLKPLVKIYEEQGYRVIGTATAWRIANALSEDLAIESRATDSWIAKANAGEQFLDARSVLIVDEAGQLSSRQMHTLLDHAERARAKVVLVGDREQLQPIGPGAALSLVAVNVEPKRIDTIVRQRHAWARSATQAFAKGDAASGLRAYASRELLTGHAGPTETLRAVADAWAQSSGTAENKKIVIAKTNAQVGALNREIRERLRADGKLKGNDVAVTTIDARRRKVGISFAAGDRIRFGERCDALGVVNGTIATIRSVSETAPDQARIVAEIGGNRIAFSTKDLVGTDGAPIKLAHAYANTIYSAQGVTADEAFVLIDPSMTRHDIYVASSRARGTTRMFYDQRAIDAQLKASLPLSERLQVRPDRHARESFLAERLARQQHKLTTTSILNSATNVLNRAMGAELE